ncbi:hypothetical protein GCM10010412_027140 [Nonomuraea recticatena]|uniref:Uncharacterized protein n=2 Tax=Nonomuraea recticatena TaxID=46178 RepID=A0ABP6E2K2_9ACTN
MYREEEWRSLAGAAQHMDDDTRDLRAQWREGSLATGWAMPHDWWTPAVEQAIKAVNRGHGLTRACMALGDARARAGVGIAEGMTDLAALFRLLGGADPPLAALRSFATGWAEAGFAPIGELRCEDPLTGLVSVAYLRTRLAEIYREGTARLHGLVVVTVTVADTWERVAALLHVAALLREVFPLGDTLVRLGHDRAAALTTRPRTRRLRDAGLVEVVALPDRYRDALATLSLWT